MEKLNEEICLATRLSLSALDAGEVKQQVAYLYRLAEIVSHMDYNKYIVKMVEVHVAEIFAVLVQMRLAYYDTGKLFDIFTEIDEHYECQSMPRLIDEAHNEIARLLGDDAWRVYFPDY